MNDKKEIGMEIERFFVLFFQYMKNRSNFKS